MVRHGAAKVALNNVEVFQMDSLGTSILEDLDTYPAIAARPRPTLSTAKSPFEACDRSRAPGRSHRGPLAFCFLDAALLPLGCAHLTPQGGHILRPGGTSTDPRQPWTAVGEEKVSATDGVSACRKHPRESGCIKERLWGCVTKQLHVFRRCSRETVPFDTHDNDSLDIRPFNEDPLILADVLGRHTDHARPPRHNPTPSGVREWLGNGVHLSTLGCSQLNTSGPSESVWKDHEQPLNRPLR